MNENTIEKNPMLEAALQAIELGLCVIPLQPNSTHSYVDDLDLYMFFKPTKEDAVGWFEEWPDANIGVMCGLPFGIVVVEKHYKSVPEIVMEQELRSPCVVAAGNIVHYYYRLTPGIKSSFEQLPGSINIYGFGYVVPLPPSRVNGISYDYLWGSVENARLSEIPNSLIKRLETINRKTRKKVAEEDLLKFKESGLFL